MRNNSGMYCNWPHHNTSVGLCDSRPTWVWKCFALVALYLSVINAKYTKSEHEFFKAK